MCFRPPTIEGATISCPKCGAEIPMEASSCPKCGAPLALNASAAPPPKIPSISRNAKMPQTPGAPKRADAQPASAASAAPAEQATEQHPQEEPSPAAKPVPEEEAGTTAPKEQKSAQAEEVSLTVTLHGKRATEAALKAIADIVGTQRADADVTVAGHANGDSAKSGLPSQPALASALPLETPPLRVPQVGGRMRVSEGTDAQVAGKAPDTPTGPGFDEAPDISNTGNYFTTGNYDNA